MQLLGTRLLSSLIMMAPATWRFLPCLKKAATTAINRALQSHAVHVVDCSTSADRDLVKINASGWPGAAASNEILTDCVLITAAIERGVRCSGAVQAPHYPQPIARSLCQPQCHTQHLRQWQPALPTLHHPHHHLQNSAVGASTAGCRSLHTSPAPHGGSRKRRQEQRLRSPETALRSVSG